MITNKLIKDRYYKLKILKKLGFDYQNSFIVKNKIHDLIIKYNNLTKKQIDLLNKEVNIAGRIVLKRLMKKTIFCNINDYFNKKSIIQIYLSKKILGEINYNIFKKLIDLGDIIGINGYLFKTNTNEFSIKVKKFFFISKCLRPLPNKFIVSLNKEIKYRQRYIDLIINNETKIIFKNRSNIINNIRVFFYNNDFIEVETPIFHYIPGGANANPFITYYNVLNQKMFLRISPELYLKRLIIGGFNRIFEINKSFRNEGISNIHNPEFTMLEFYISYTNYEWMMFFIQKLISYICISLFNKKKIIYKNNIINFCKPFYKITLLESILKYNKSYKYDQLFDKKFIIHELINKHNDLIKENLLDMKIENLQILFFEKNIENKLIQPTYITDYPKIISPLAKSTKYNKDITERFELFIGGFEIANGFSELNDPKEQSIRFKEQISTKKIDEKYYYDNDYIQALEYGMPYTSGCGIGIDRLIMLLTNIIHIKDIILFPYLKKTF